MTAIRALRRGEGRTRHVRRPTFPIAGIMKPYGLYPLMCHPVAPGDTLTHLEGQFRVLSKGIKHPLVGAWLEMWAVYVRLTDLQRPTAPDQPPPILAQFIKEGVSTAGVTFAAASPRYFGIGAQVKWLQLVTERVAKAFFVHSEEPLRTIDGVPQIKMLGANWYQNAVFTPANVAPVATDVEALDEQISQTQLGRLGDMIELTYDRWVEEWGVEPKERTEGVPEILRYFREWTLPTNTVEATTGVPTSCWTWSGKLSMEKAKRFDEPGFVVLVGAVRPKMYASKQISSMLGQLWGRGWWEPPMKVLDPVDQLDIVSAANVMSGMDSSSVRVDRADVWTHGEQFVNCGTAEHPYTLPVATGPSWVAASTPEDLRGEYCSLADVDALFSGAPANQKFCFYEGIVRLSVKGVVTDETPDPAVRINRQVRG